MPLEPPDQAFFNAACGYAQLGMLLEANEELDKVNPFNRAAPEILALRVAIYSGLGKWPLMKEIAKRLADFQPDDVQWVVSYAYATRRTDSIDAAKEILLTAQLKFPAEAVISFNLACYECQLDNLEAAKEYLKRAFAIDLDWRVQALEDHDLKPLWDTL
jgi:tetratricopeptide (TPR) repeat protein